MKKIRDLMNKYPLLYAVIGLALLWFAVRVVPAIPAGALKGGLNEVKALIIVLLVYLLLSGRRQDLKPDLTGFSYGLRIMRYIYIFILLMGLGGILSILVALKNGADKALIGTRLLNSILLALCVGAVEEFTCRAMMFSGLVRVFGRTRRGVILAAVISGAAFGFIHVASEVFGGEITDAMGAAQVVGKTLQAGLFGFVLALIYFRNRSIWSVAALHSLFDFALLLGGVSSDSHIASYIKQDASGGKLSSIAYIVLSVIMIPLIVRSLRELNKEPEPYICPGDEDFAPRQLTFVKEKKKKTEK